MKTPKAAWYASPCPCSPDLASKPAHPLQERPRVATSPLARITGPKSRPQRTQRKSRKVAKNGEWPSGHGPPVRSPGKPKAHPGLPCCGPTHRRSDLASRPAARWPRRRTARNAKRIPSKFASAVLRVLSAFPLRPLRPASGTNSLQLAIVAGRSRRKVAYASSCASKPAWRGAWMRMDRRTARTMAARSARATSKWSLMIR